MSMKKTFFGALPDGKPVDCYTIENQNGMRAEILTYGGTLNKLYVPDQNGVFADVLIGFDTLEGHLNHSDYQGMLVGRYANRIADGAFVLNGEEYHVTKNENQITCLHGGGEFSHAVWDAQPVGEDALRLSYESPEGAQGFPGRVTAHAVYTLTQENVLRIDYYAVSDRDTILNLTNHAYFNLGGYDAGQITGHILRLNASQFIPTDARNIPTGELRDVEGTPFDFREPKAIGDGIDSDYAPIASCKGYDHNFCIEHWDGSLREAAEVYEAAKRACDARDDRSAGCAALYGQFPCRASRKRGEARRMPHRVLPGDTVLPRYAEPAGFSFLCVPGRRGV